MVQFEIPGDPISVTFGIGAFGVFLSVFDKRLAWDSSATPEVNAVTEAIGVKDGGGSYFDLHTKGDGFGIKVDHDTMATYLRRFGASEEQIASLNLDKGRCDDCAATTKLKCSQCHVVCYCSKDCQRKDWPVHKMFCQLYQQVPLGKGVLAILLPEKGTRPRLVRVPQRQEYDNDEGGYYWTTDTNAFLGGLGQQIWSDRFPATMNVLSSSYCIYCKEDFLVDNTSSSNESINFISSKGQNRNLNPYWRGNVLLMKGCDNNMMDRKFVDIGLCDVRDALWFLLLYSKKVQLDHFLD